MFHMNFIIEGESVLVNEAGDETPLNAGDFVLVNPSEKHQYRNKEDQYFKMIWRLPKEFELKRILMRVLQGIGLFISIVPYCRNNKNEHFILRDLINDPIFFVNSSRPVTSQMILECFRIPCSLVRGGR